MNRIAGDWTTRRRRWCVTAAVALPLLVGMAGFAASSAESDGGASGVVAAQPHDEPHAYGRTLFRQFCAGCHTLADAGAHGGRYDLDKVQELAGPQLWGAIRGGAPGMPPWGAVLTDKETKALVVYVLDVSRKSGTEGFWHDQIIRRRDGETPAWKRIARTIASAG